MTLALPCLSLTTAKSDASFLPQTFEGYAPALALAFSSEGRILASGLSNGKIELWDIDTDQCFQLLECDGELIQTVVFHREERTLLSVSRRGTLHLWDTVICYYIPPYSS